MPKRTYGFKISEEKFADCPAVVARVLARTGDEESPINPRSEGEDSIWDAPKKTDGLALASLEIITWRDLNFKYLTEVQVRIDSVRFVDQRLAERMLKTMKRINRELRKNNAREAGDVLMAVAKAIGATWHVEAVGGEKGHFYHHSQWHFGTLIQARDKFRALVDKLRSPVEAREQAEAARKEAEAV
jgi:hypothetical protein